MPTMSFTLCLFLWKTLCKDSFPHFPVFGSTKKKKIGQWKTIFSQRKILIKIRLIFYRLFSNFFFFWKTISLSRVASLINIIFVCSRRKHNFLAPSLSHGKLSHFFTLPFTFFSSHILTVTNFGLSSSHRSLSLTVYFLFFLHVSLPLCNTIL